jgi:tetratricopeptide (TPR) repeat protein
MTKQREELGAADVGLFAGFLGLNVQACFSVALRFPEVACFYWLAAGLLLAWPRLAARARPEELRRAPSPRAMGSWVWWLALLLVLAGVGWLWYGWAWLPWRSAWDFGRARRLEERKMDAEARTAYHQALLGRPPYVDRLRLLRMLGDLEFRNREFARATVIYQDALRLAPDVIDNEVVLADASTLSGQVEAGLTLYRRAGAVAANYPDLRVRWAAAAAMLAVRERAAGHLAAAANRWREAVRADPTRAEYHLGLIRCFIAAGRKAEAEAAFRRMVTRFGDDPRLREQVEELRSQLRGEPEPAGGGGKGG